MIANVFKRRLSAKLLIMTIIFVMIAEVLIFIPSSAVFRQNWLQERAEYAGLLTLAIEGVPNFQGTEMLSKQFMEDTSVSMVSQKREGRSQLVLGMPPTSSTLIVADLRTPNRFMNFKETGRAFFGNGEGYIRILSKPTVQDVDALEVLVPQAALKKALTDYCHNILLWSLAISVLTGLMVYVTLSRMIVRPIQRLAGGLATFREDPRKRIGNSTKIRREDEIGQLEHEFVDMKDGVRTAFKQQERLATLGMAMAKINHDLRNVLTSAQLISDRLADDKEDRIKKMGQRLVRAVERGVKLCEATLSFSQSVEERPDPKPVRLASLIGETAGDVMAEEGRVRFSNKVSTDMVVRADPDQIYRIFHNLFRNAVQAMASSEEKRLVVRAEIMDDKACIEIEDTGPGLPKTALDNLFKAFTSSARKGGTGLGLTISRELARANGGNLALKNTDENGTVFDVSLPLHVT
ncbi:MAG: HAMP domain-containing histidine kinase [Acidimicrobiales bacterium]|nr:HAMP domain-containing histidine kinase [Hyphomonadaceae bacterium]RZV42024.1 MAG: HAMP domain-containing histidine kinase [Acidimicrobiales bacterium]